jgi:peptidyl-dipeptidase Dcp
MSLAGTNVYLDFVELPSQIMENWAEEKLWLDGVARHYESGSRMPDDLLQHILDARHHNSGYAFVRQLSFAMNDMAWHTLSHDLTLSIEAFEQHAMEPAALFPLIEGCVFSTGFSHIFGGGYASGYYGYKWAEVLDADAFSLFREHGIFDRGIARAFRVHILSRGGTEHPMELYKRFRGQEPSLEPLLRRNGLVADQV